LGELEAAFAEFDGLEAGEAVGDGAEFGVVHVGAAGQLEEAELELFFGEGFDGGVVVGFNLFACVVVFADLPVRAEVAEGGGADLDAEFFAGVLGGLGVVHGSAEVDELLFLGVGEISEDRVVAARAGGRSWLGLVLGRGRIFLR